MQKVSTASTGGIGQITFGRTIFALRACYLVTFSEFGEFGEFDAMFHD